MYPAVLSEQATLDRVLAGASLARYGDGEFKLCEGGSIKSQIGHPVLAQRLRAILHDSGDCLVGIPNMRETVKPFWAKHEARWGRLLRPHRAYASAFVSRPDSAPWIDTPDYWQRVRALWTGRTITLVRGSTKSLTADLLIQHGADQVHEILAPRQHAWADYDALLARIGTPDRVLLCIGPTSTVMAVDLCARGVHAIDLGHLGMFFKKHVRGDPMWVSDADRASA
jgi:hypothetical protein